jgi:integrase
VEYRIAGNPGLVLAVIKPNRNGRCTRTWRVHYSISKDGRRLKRKLKVGRYPAITLAEARRRAAEIMDAVQQGGDPVADGQAAIAQAARDGLIFKDLVREYLADQRAAAVRSVAEIERTLTRDAIPQLGHRHPSAIEDVDIERVVDVVAARGSKAMARHLLVYLRGVFNHALRGSPQLREKYGLKFNPADTVGRGRRGKPGKYGRPGKKERSLDDGEIAAFWSAVDRSGMEVTTKAILRLLLLTGQRLGEVRGAVIEELKVNGRDARWELPGTRTKNGLAHIVPLSPLAAKIFTDAIGSRIAGPCFPSPETKDGVASEFVIRRALSRLFTQGRLTCSRFTPHDLRRTVETGLAGRGTAPEIRDRVLNHAPQTVGDRHYNQHGYAMEKRAALDTWAQHIEKLTKSRPE